MKDKKINHILFTLLLAPLLLFPFLAHGQTRDELRGGQSITMSPVTFELTADPGNTLANVIKVTNPGDTSIGVQMEVEDFSAVGEAGKIAIMEEENKTYSLKQWISASPERFTLGPGEAKIVNFTINVPQDAEPGGHYASLLSVVTADTAAVSGSAVAQKVGALILLSVSGDATEDLLIKEFSAPHFSEKGPIPFVIRFENIGSIHVKPMGFISISDRNGNKIEDIPFEQKNILPGAKRKLDVAWDKEFLFGKYHADLVGTYGNSVNGKQIYATLNFWVIPWKIILIITLAALIMLFVIYKGRHRLALALRALIKGR